MPALPPDTERLHFAWWRDSDLDDARALWGDPRVTRLMDKRERLPEAEIAQRLRTEIDNAAHHDIQYWRLERRDTRSFVGCCGLRPYPEQAQAAWEFGFHLLPAHWAQGFATEAGRAVRDFAFTELGVKELYAGHHPDNHASRAVLEKLGFVKIDAWVFASGRLPSGASSGRPSAQLALVVALAQRYAVGSQNVVGGHAVEVEVRQREREDERLGSEGELARPNLEIQVFAFPFIDFIWSERAQGGFRPGHHRPQFRERYRAY